MALDGYVFALTGQFKEGAVMSVLTVRGAGVRRRRRWLFRDLDVSVEPGEMVAVVGPPGSGRTTVLLALARRFRLSAGRVAVDGTAALGHVADVSAPEPVFTVAEHVRERLALLGRPRSEAADVPLHGLAPGRRGRELAPYERQVLGLILAGLSAPAVIALDGVDDGLDAAEQADLWRLLDEIAASGTAVLVTAREVDAARVSTVIQLGTEPKTAVPRVRKGTQPQPVGKAQSQEATASTEEPPETAEPETRAKDEPSTGTESGLRAPGAAESQVRPDGESPARAESGSRAPGAAEPQARAEGESAPPESNVRALGAAESQVRAEAEPQVGQGVDEAAAEAVARSGGRR
jgi:ABC-2 type transport system ATP-binding protein